MCDNLAELCAHADVIVVGFSSSEVTESLAKFDKANGLIVDLAGMDPKALPKVDYRESAGERDLGVDSAKSPKSSVSRSRPRSLPGCTTATGGLRIIAVGSTRSRRRVAPGPGLGLARGCTRSFEAGDYSPAYRRDRASALRRPLPDHAIDAQQMPFAPQSKDVVILFEAIYYLPDAVASWPSARACCARWPRAHRHRQQGPVGLSPQSTACAITAWESSRELFAAHGFVCEFFCHRAGRRGRLATALAAAGQAARRDERDSCRGPWPGSAGSSVSCSADRNRCRQKSRRRGPYEPPRGIRADVAGSRDTGSSIVSPRARRL